MWWPAQAATDVGTAATLPLQDSCTSTWLSEDKLRIEVNSTSCLCQPRAGIRLVQPVYAGAGIGFGSVMHSNTTCDLTYSHALTYMTTSAGLESWNNDWHHCVGSHELHLGLQLQRQHPTKLRAVQRMIALLNARGLTIGIAGPPGAGKSTLQGLAVYYGARMMELENIRGGVPNMRLAMEYATWHQKLESFKGVHDRKTVLVGLSGLTELYSVVPALMIRVLLLPPTGAHKQRWTQRDQEAAAQFKASLSENSSKKRSQAYGVSARPPSDKFIAAQAMFDVVVMSDGCAEQSLVDLVAGVFKWMSIAPTMPELAQRWERLNTHYGGRSQAHR